MRFGFNIIFYGVLLITNCLAYGTDKVSSVTQEKQWSILLYRGTTSKETLVHLVEGQYHGVGETLYTAEVAYTLDRENRFRKFVSPVVDTVQLAANLTKRDDDKDPDAVYEGDGYVIFRWTKFPWREYLHTSFAAAEGISYASHVPYVEKGSTSDDSRRLLNYLMFEITVALPKYSDIELVGRIHHRSTAFGLFGNGNSGSNNIGVGIRYYF